MARLFNDGAGTSYDAAQAKFVNNKFTTFTPFNYTDTLLFKQKVDNSMAGSMRDCGECHVGGGANEYVPAKSPELRTSLRDYVFGTAITAFNYFIDSYGSRGDGFNTDATPASFAPTGNDYGKTGVLEMDCLMCHLKDYSWEERKKAVRTGKFDASRTTGALLGTASTVDGDGVNVNYDPFKVVPNADSTALKLASSVAGNILATPDSNNCASCHMAEHAVDWKKRGDSWTGSAEVHFSLGCMGCHKRKDAGYAKLGTSGFAGLKGTYGFNNVSSASAGDDSKKLGQCDPAKGSSPYESLWNATDSTAKNCDGCHTKGGDFDPVTQTVTPYETYGAPDPTAAHQARGLTARIVQKGATMNGVPTASHVEMIACEACHSRKGNFTGGAMVDGTGTDIEGRLADHENNNVTRQDMTNKNFMAWQGDRLTATNLSTSIFWRDKNDIDFDANNDGRGGGMDALLQTHVANINRANTYSQGPRVGQPLGALTQLGTVTAADIADHISAIDKDLEYQLGLKATPGDLNTRTHATRLSFMGVTFRTNHDISAKSSAWGSGGCGDCHKGSTDPAIAGTVGDTSAGGFYNGRFMVKGDTLNMSWTGGGVQVTPFAMVNGSTQKSDFHPGVKERSGVRSLAVQFASNGTTIRDIDRSEGLYETGFNARNTAFAPSITGTAITLPVAAPGTTQGWLLKIEATNNGGQTVIARTKMVGANSADMTALLTNLTPAFTGTWDGTAYSGGQNEFGIRASGNTLIIEGRNGYSVRLHPQTDAGYFGLAGALWGGKNYKGVISDLANAAVSTGSRNNWVAYLNSLGDPAQQTKLGIGIDPVARFAAFPDADPNTSGNQVIKGTAYDMSAVTAGNSAAPLTTYQWTFSDGSPTVSNTTGSLTGKSFATNGYVLVTLKVTDEEGKVVTAAQSVNVVDAVAPAGISIGPATAAKAVSQTFTFSGLPAHNSLTIFWGDGKSQTTADTDTGSTATAAHAYLTSGTKRITIYLYNNGVQVGTKYTIITVTL